MATVIGTEKNRCFNMAIIISANERGKMATYEEIKKANDEARVTPIEKGGKINTYVEVNERIKAFRKVYPEGFILTDMVSNADGVCVFRTEVGFYLLGSTKVVLGTGTAYENEGSSFINKTSYIENCETSSVGRALGMAGFGIDDDIASAEEIKGTIAISEADKAKNQQKALNDLRAMYEKNGGKTWNKWLAEVAPDGMTNEIYGREMARLKKEITDKAETVKEIRNEPS